MRRFAIGAVVIASACGGTSAGKTIGSTGGTARGPVLVFLGLGPTMMFEAACYEPPGSAACAELRAAALDGTKQIVTPAATFRITGPASDGCDASGATEVVGLERVAGDDEASPGVVTYPADAPIGLETYRFNSTSDAATRGQAVTPTVRAALAALATTDTVSRDDARAITAAEIVVEQVVTANVDGDARPDTIIAANVPVADGIGYRWSALVVVLGGEFDAARSVWTSDLEHLIIDASFDLDGDGRRELVYTAEYYEGSGHGVATVDGKLTIKGGWGCGA